MPSIRALPPDVVAKIAAGEVVERPASVVKELLENSLDAGATRIDIDLEQGGIDAIRVIDNGCGFAADDLPLAFAPHATSKLEDADDLYELVTLGFRGEALASIGGVAKVALQSRRREADHGYELRCDGSVLSAIKPWGGPPGTRIAVEQPFYNIPVRRTFLKSLATELGHVSEVVTRLALAHPAVHFVLKHNGKLVFDLPSSAGLRDRIGHFFGTEVESALYDIDSGPGPLRVVGCIADPKCSRGNSKLQYLFVNGRWFRDRSIAHAFQEAYHGLLMTGRYAVGFLFLDVPPNAVDINVHPQKHEVRFREQSTVYSLVRSTVKARLMKERLIPNLQVPVAEYAERPELPPATWPTFSAPSQPTPSLFSPRREAIEQAPSPWDEPPAEEEATTVAEPSPELASAPPLPFEWPALPSGSALQVHDAYIVLETADGMLVIDQHALHERILYEQLRQRVRDGKLEVQRLLIPEAIELPPVQVAAVLDAVDELARLGLDVADFGGNTILLSSYPTLLARRAPIDILKGAVDYLVGHDRAPRKEQLFDHLLATMACKAAVKAGDKLTQDEIAHLLELRNLAEDSHHCPHGRPTSLLFSRAQLDKQFGRT